MFISIALFFKLSENHSWFSGTTNCNHIIMPGAPANLCDIVTINQAVK